MKEFEKKFADWQKAFSAAMAAMSSVGGDAKAQAKANEEYQKVYSRALSS